MLVLFYERAKLHPSLHILQGMNGLGGGGVREKTPHDSVSERPRACKDEADRAVLHSPSVVGVLTPPYFNLAEGRRVTATATCGEGVEGPELFCKLIGVNTDFLNQHDNLLIQGQVCDHCDPTRPDKAHPPEYAVDGTETWWQSPPLSRGSKYNEVNLTIDLGQFNISKTSSIAGKLGRKWVSNNEQFDELIKAPIGSVTPYTQNNITNAVEVRISGGIPNGTNGFTIYTSNGAHWSNDIPYETIHGLLYMVQRDKIGTIDEEHKDDSVEATADERAPKTLYIFYLNQSEYWQILPNLNFRFTVEIYHWGVTGVEDASYFKLVQFILSEHVTSLLCSRREDGRPRDWQLRASLCEREVGHGQKTRDISWDPFCCESIEANSWQLLLATASSIPVTYRFCLLFRNPKPGSL
ncbi:hypothetical protein J6590_034493 [Homalodisca vitripennis]|nr:hypothetical protein J6590_034493 [Homalodisca vitripennis]